MNCWVFLFFIYLIFLPKHELNKNSNNRGKTASPQPSQRIAGNGGTPRRMGERVIPKEEHTSWLSKLNAFLQAHTHK